MKKIIAVDEANFSPSLAGDCVVCALLSLRKVEGVKDSKKLAHKRRLELFKKLQKSSLYSIVPATVNEINSTGIYMARNMAILSAVRKLLFSQNYGIKNVLIDGYFSKKWLKFFSVDLRVPVECMVNGDDLVYECSAASIMARVYADALFQGFGEFYPGYNLEKCHGSPDKRMYEALRKKGPSPYHRTGYGKGWWEKIMKGEQRER